MKKIILVTLMAFAMIVTVAPVTSGSSESTITYYDGQWITGWLHGEKTTYDVPAKGVACVDPGPYPYEFNLTEPLHVHLQIRHALWRPEPGEETNLTIYLDGAPVLEADTIGLAWYPGGDGIELIDLGTVPTGIHYITMSATHSDYYAMDWFRVLELVEIHDVAVTNVSAPAEATQGDIVTINVTVANQGGYDETFNVKVSYDTSLVDTQPVTLVLGDSKTIPFSWETADATPTTYTITAEAILADANLTNNEATTTITINPAPVHDIAINNVVQPSVLTVDVGGSVDINLTIKNEGNVQESFTINLYAGVDLVETETATLAAGATQTYTLTWTTTAIGNFTIEARVPPVQDEDDTADNTWTTTAWRIRVVPEFPTLIPLLLALLVLAVSTVILKRRTQTP